MNLSLFHLSIKMITGLVFLASCSTHEPKQKFMAQSKGVIITKEVVYRLGKQRMKGFFAIPGGKGPFPGVLVVHEWWGQTEYPRQRARMLAEQGYAAFAVDMYGNGKTTNHPKEAKAFSSKVMGELDRAWENFNQALRAFKEQKGVDRMNMAAIGYCFGGAIVLEMARRGANLKMVASYHGDLTPLVVNKIPPMKTRILIFNGEDDPMVTKEALSTASKKLKKANVPYKLFNYKGARHGFTNKQATAFGGKFGLPLAYNAEADKDSWKQTLNTLKWILR